MKKRLKMVAGVYIIPFILMVMFPLVKELKLNGEELGVFGLMVSGFLLGIVVEGALLILAFTAAVLSGKMDQ